MESDNKDENTEQKNNEKKVVKTAPKILADDEVGQGLHANFLDIESINRMNIRNNISMVIGYMMRRVENYARALADNLKMYGLLVDMLVYQTPTALGHRILIDVRAIGIRTDLAKKYEKLRASMGAIDALDEQINNDNWNLVKTLAWRTAIENQADVSIFENAMLESTNIEKTPIDNPLEKKDEKKKS